MLALAFGAPLPAPPKHPYVDITRVAYVESALNAVQNAPSEVLQQAHANLAVYERGACVSASQRLRSECLMSAAKRFCLKRPKVELPECALYTDVVVSNLIAEKQLIPTDERYEIMKRSKDWRREMARKTRRLQGALAADFGLQAGISADNATLSKKIDSYCTTSADQTNLSWQTCVASLAWFIGSRALDTEPKEK